VTRRLEPATREQIDDARPRFVALVIAKARRFAADPRAGYLAGCIPRPRVRLDAKQGELDRSRFLADRELAWVYGVAERDVPTDYYVWRVIEGPDDAYELVLTTRGPISAGPKA
jgi:hypothetical protein